MRSTLFNFIPLDSDGLMQQVPDDQAEFDWISVSEPPC